MDNRLRKIFGIRADELSAAEIAAAEAVLEYERRMGPIYRKSSNYPARATRDAIDKTLEDNYGVTIRDVMMAGRQRNNTYFRFAVCSIFSELTGLSDSEVMRNLGGGRNRTNVLYARKQISSLMPYPDFCDKYNTIKDGTLKLLTEWNIPLE